MIIDRYDMGVTIDISPGVSARKSKRFSIDPCTAHLTVRLRVMHGLWFVPGGQRARWRTCRRRLLTSRVRPFDDHEVNVVDVRVLKSANPAALFVRLFYGAETWRWLLHASTTRFIVFVAASGFVLTSDSGEFVHLHCIVHSFYITHIWQETHRVNLEDLAACVQVCLHDEERDVQVPQHRRL